MRLNDFWSNILISMHLTEMRFDRFLSGEFITAIVVNPPERKMAKCTSVHLCDLDMVPWPTRQNVGRVRVKEVQLVWEVENATKVSKDCWVSSRNAGDRFGSQSAVWPARKQQAKKEFHHIVKVDRIGGIGVKNVFILWCCSSRITDAQWTLFSLKSRTLGLGQTNWVEKF